MNITRNNNINNNNNDKLTHWLLLDYEFLFSFSSFGHVPIFIGFGITILLTINLLLSFQPKSKSNQVNPLLSSSFFTKQLFFYINPFINLCKQKGKLNKNDAFPLHPLEEASKNVNSLEINIKSSSSSLQWALWKTFGGTVLFLVTNSLVSNGLLLILTWIMEQFIASFTDKTSRGMQKGISFALIYFIFNMIYNLLWQNNFLLQTRLFTRIHSSLIGYFYRNILHNLTNETRQLYTSGEILNLITTDIMKIKYFIAHFNYPIGDLVKFLIVFVLLWQKLGWTMLIGVCILIGLIPANSYISYTWSSSREKTLALRDRKLKLLQDILHGIRVLKFYAWEKAFGDKMNEIRSEEGKINKKVNQIMSLNSAFWELGSFVILLCTLACFLLVDSENNILTASSAYGCLKLFSLLNSSITCFPAHWHRLLDYKISIQRLETFLQQSNNNNNNNLSGQVQVENQENIAISIKNASFSWKKSSSSASMEEENPPRASTLKDITLTIPQGSFTAIVGKIGSGKSSLLSAIIGENHRIEGSISINGSLAYVPQIAWIQHLTVKENILFGSMEISRESYQRVLDQCCLVSDLEMFPLKDETIIGEDGINLSGGQKQRISLARATLLDSDIYLLDDPLSALDVHVGQKIFHNLLSSKTGALAKKTRVLVTHSLQWLPHVDAIVVLNDDGQIEEQGSFEELMKPGKLLYEIINNNNIHCSYDECDNKTESETTTTTKKEKTNLKVTEDFVALDDDDDDDEKNMNVSHVFQQYIYSRGVLLSFIVFLVSIFFSFTEVLPSILTQKFVENNQTNSQEASSVHNYLASYGFTLLLLFVEVGLLGYLKSTADTKSSQSIHHNLFTNLLKAPIHFFDSTPSGEITHLLTRDMDTVDANLSYVWNNIQRTTFAIITSAVLIFYQTPLLIVALIPLSWLHYRLFLDYLPMGKKFRQIQTKVESPINLCITETLAGLAVIRSSNKRKEFVQRLDNQLNYIARWSFLSQSLYLWLNVRLDLLASVVSLMVTLFCIASFDWISAGLVGLLMSQVTQIQDNLSSMIFEGYHLAKSAGVFHRILHYTEMQTEDIKNNPKQSLTTTTTTTWHPKQGKIEFKDFSARYRPNLPLVLRNWNIQIESGEKIGIVGRTGAGKSTLAMVLFRLIDFDQGEIRIDGVNICDIDLQQLRMSMSILPQDPVLFSGNLRSNLDPFGDYEDETLWQILQTAHLKDWVELQGDGLNYECGEAGRNLSVGQRQLVCLARALLRKSKILILDEATAAVDQDTDRLLMDTIWKEFQHATVLIIAHRIQTIKKTDRVIVVENGEVAEVGAPNDLMKDKTSLFYSLAASSGLISH